MTDEQFRAKAFKKKEELNKYVPLGHVFLESSIIHQPAILKRLYFEWQIGRRAIEWMLVMKQLSLITNKEWIFEKILTDWEKGPQE